MTELFRQLRPFEPVIDLVRLGVFLGLVALGLLTAARLRRGVREPRDSRAVDPLLLYVLVVSIGVGLVQQESWPFTTWALVHNVSRQRARTWEMIGLDAAGRGHLIDPRVLQPMAPEEFGAWMFGRFQQLPPEAQAGVGRFILNRAEAARQRVRRGDAVAANDWLLGPLSAPYHFQPPGVWGSPADVPETPFTGLQIWTVEWNVEERFADEGRVSRRILFELHDDAPG